jgi:SAM-dependent methyltransferase
MKATKQFRVLCVLCLAMVIACIGCATRSVIEITAAGRVVPDKQQPQPKSALAPVYAPLAEWLTQRFNLASQKGIGIDLGSGKGDLIAELAQRSPEMHWINADIDPANFAPFFEKVKTAGVADRVSAMMADAKRLPFRDGYADIIVSRGSFPFWGDLQAGLSEVNRVLKPGGAAYIGRGFSENLPVEIARQIRDRQKKNDGFPKYDVDETEKEMRRIMDELGVRGYQIIRPKPPGSEGVNYGIWVEWRKEVQ